MAEPQNLPIPTSNPSAHRFKPYTLYNVSTRGSFPRKRYYKHIHNLYLEPRLRVLLQRKPLPKTVRSLRFDSWSYLKNFSLLNKFVKPSKKYLRSIKENTYFPKVQEPLPVLTELDVGQTQESLRILSLNSNLKKLRFIVHSSFFEKMSTEELLRKHKARLSRNLAKMRGLKSLSVMIKEKEVKSAIALLEMIDQNLSLDSLEQYSIKFVPDLLTKSFQKLPEQKASISKVLSRLTYLDADSSVWYVFLTSSGKLDNLTVLNLRLASEEIAWDPKDIFQFHALPQLKSLLLHFKAHSESAERNFFENFSLPSSLEDLSLALMDFKFSLIGSNATLLSQFFKRSQKAKEIKTLNLDITENASNYTQTAQFYCPFIKCFKNLETLKCKHIKKVSLLSKTNPGAEAKPLDFQDFWTAVTPSKETLQSISVHVKEIIFSQEINSLESEFPKLQKLSIQENVLSAAELGRFCLKIPFLTGVVIREMKFVDCEELRIFLDDMKEIPKGRNFEFYLHVGNIIKEPLISCLKKYIEDVKVKGRLGIYLCSIPIEETQAYEEVLKMAREKGCFQCFSIATTVRPGSKIN